MRKIPSSRLWSAGCQWMPWCHGQRRLGTFGYIYTHLACSEKFSKYTLSTPNHTVRRMPSSSLKTLRQPCNYGKGNISFVHINAFYEIIMHLGVDQRGSWVSQRQAISTIQHVDIDVLKQLTPSFLLGELQFQMQVLTMLMLMLTMSNSDFSMFPYWNIRQSQLFNRFQIIYNAAIFCKITPISSKF